MCYQAFEFGRKIPNVIVYQDDIYGAAKKLRLSGNKYIVDNVVSSYASAIASNNFGNYKTANGQYEPVASLGAYDGLTPVTSATASTDIISNQTDVI